MHMLLTLSFTGPLRKPGPCSLGPGFPWHLLASLANRSSAFVLNSPAKAVRAALPQPPLGSVHLGSGRCVATGNENRTQRWQRLGHSCKGLKIFHLHNILETPLELPTSLGLPSPFSSLPLPSSEEVAAQHTVQGVWRRRPSRAAQ